MNPNMSVYTLLVVLLCREIAMAAAQPGGGSRSDPYLAGRVTPSMAIIIIVLITAVFFMAFFSIYIRHCSDGNAGGSMRAMVAAVAGRSTRRKGLDPDKLHALPTFPYCEVKGLKIGKGALECAVCLNEFEESETLRFIPKCDHVFHSDCIDVWLGSNTTCPVCRADLDSSDPVQPESEFEPGTPDPTVDIQPEQIRPVRSWSRKRSFARLPKSHSTGHSLVQPGEDCERFTLVLPDEVRKRLVNRGLDRVSSLVVLSRESSSRRGYRTGGEGSSRGRNYRRIDRLEPGVKSDRWVFTKAPPFFSRATSFKAPLNCVGPKTEGSDSQPSDPARLPI